jgi:hypothetical protein
VLGTGVLPPGIGPGFQYEASGFCREIGLELHVERSRRFVEHRACLAELIAALQARGQDGVRDLFDRDRLRAFTALTEGAELVESLPFIRPVPRYLIRRKLTRVLQGPPLAWETSTAKGPRQDAWRFQRDEITRGGGKTSPRDRVDRQQAVGDAFTAPRRWCCRRCW